MAPRPPSPSSGVWTPPACSCLSALLRCSAALLGLSCPFLSWQDCMGGTLSPTLLMQGLMRISDFQRRRILQLIKHFRVVRKARSYVRARSMATSFPASSRRAIFFLCFH